MGAVAITGEMIWIDETHLWEPYNVWVLPEGEEEWQFVGRTEGDGIVGNIDWAKADLTVEQHSDPWSDLWGGYQRALMGFNGPEPIVEFGTKVKYTLNRPLTFAERERFREYFGKTDNINYSFNNYGDVVTITTDQDSRQLTKHLSSFVEREYLNVYPRSAGTLSPKVVV